MPERLKRPLSPATVIATIALALAIGGGSFAIARIDVASVKRVATHVADQRITALAPKLSVKHARTAGDAAKLGGAPPRVYLDRVSSSASGRTPLPLPGQTAVDVTAASPLRIAIPRAVGFVEVDGSATDYGAASPSSWVLWIQLDGLCATSGSAFESRPYGRLAGADDQETLSQHFVFAVSPGVHTLRLCTYSDQPSAVTSRVLVARTVPAEGAGAAPRARRASRTAAHGLGGPITRP